VKKTVTRLADGRELIYYDESDAAVRDADDRRDLPPAATLSTLRYDTVLGEWVAMASHRQDRTYLPPADQCPLDPSTPDRLTEIPAPDYDVVVFENRFPTFSSTAANSTAANSTAAERDTTGPGTPDPEEGMFRAWPGVGRCEVVCFTSDHDAPVSALSPKRMRTVVDAWADRTEELSRLPYVEQVFCFENRGEEIGVTLSHPHGQIYGYPFVTPRTRQMLDSARRYRQRTGRNLFAEVLREEVAAAERIVARTGYWTAFVPYAARWPLEVHVYPNRQVPSIVELTDAERDDFGPLYLELLRRMEASYGFPLPYISAWHQAPVRVDRDLSYLHLQVFSIRRAPGKLKYLAGSESGMGAFVSDVLPENAARALREARI
jgi:UDPglucose--hexose-1-phosphate uridylyltransferase